MVLCFGRDPIDFFSIDAGDEIEVGERRFLITGHERERRFGIEDPKFWVKRAVDVKTRERKILKFAFFESFMTSLGGVKIRCFRNPDKEARILEIMKGHPLFMQGESYGSSDGNLRILDIVHGTNFFVKLFSFRMSHEEYVIEHLPFILKQLRRSFEAISELHRSGFRHGDIRNDHLIVEKTTGNFVWIDFDYDYDAPENPFSLDLFGMGNILLYAVGKGFHDLYTIASDRDTYGDLFDNLCADDFSILDKARLMNIKKVYPYIPDELNYILMHFSRGSPVFYETTEEFLDDFATAIAKYRI